MLAHDVIAEALAAIHRRHSVETLKVVPRFRNVSVGNMRLEGMNYCSSRDLMVNAIDAAPGVYPVVWSMKQKPRGPQQEPGADMVRSPPFEDFIRDEAASISLWTIPLDHACVPKSEHCGGETQDQGEELEPQTGSCRSEYALQDTQDVWAFKAIRVALDFTLRDGRPMRRTGTVLLQGDKLTKHSDLRGPEDLSSMGWTVRWDHWKLFAGMQASLIVPVPPSRPEDSGSGSPSDPIEVEDDEGRFVFLVWKEKMPMSNMEGADRGIVTMIFKKHDATSGQSEPVEFTEEEKRAFGVGLSEGDGFGITTAS